MAKPLATILKKYSDVIAGKIPASEVSNLTLGKEPGVDYAPKMADEREFVASHSVEKHPDRVGNGPDVYSAANIKQTSAEGGKHGHIPDPKSKNAYKQANEEFELDEGEIRKPTSVDKLKWNLYMYQRQRRKDERLGTTNPNTKVMYDDLSKRIGDDPNKSWEVLQHLPAFKQANEEVELNETELSDKEFDKVVSTKGVFASHDRKGGVHFSKDGKSLGFKMHPQGRAGADHVHTWLQNMGFKKQGSNHLGVDYYKEETEQDFNSANRKTTLAERIGLKYGKVNEKKDESEYGYEGEMATTQLKTIMRHADHLIKMMKPDTDLPEWVQSKITKAEDYISTAHDYLMSEMNEAYDKNMSEMVCEACGDSYGKPTNESCKYDSRDPKGKNWVSKEQASAADKQPMYDGKKDKKDKKVVLLDKDLQEKAESEAQQKLMAMAYRYKKDPKSMSGASRQVKKLAKTMTLKQLRDYAATKHEGLPKKVAKESADTPIKMPSNPSNQTADYNSGANLGNFTV